MDEFDFTEDEIREQLETLGYSSVPKGRIQEFQRDLENLVKQERSKNSSLFSTSEQSSTDSEIPRSRQLLQHAVGRPPLDDTNHRPTSAVTGNNTTDAVKYGKENIFIAAPKHPGDSVMPARVERLGDMSRQAWDIPQEFSMYSDQERHDDHDTEDKPTDDTLNTTSSTERRTMKRKVLRKRDGHAEIYETESESGDLDSLQERLRNLPLSVHIQRPATAPCQRTYKLPSSDPEPCYRLPDGYDGLKALIRPMSKEPHTRNVKKNDPVSRYQQYRTSWDSYRAPGEKAHKGLRWGVREQMLYHDAVVEKKQHKVFLANNYKVPTDKKRKNLRWQIRNDLAQGVVPPSLFD